MGPVLSQTELWCAGSREREGTFPFWVLGNDQCCFRNIQGVSIGKGMKDLSENTSCHRFKMSN